MKIQKSNENNIYVVRDKFDSDADLQIFLQVSPSKRAEMRQMFFQNGLKGGGIISTPAFPLIQTKYIRLCSFQGFFFYRFKCTCQRVVAARNSLQGILVELHP